MKLIERKDIRPLFYVQAAKKPEKTARLHGINLLSRLRDSQSCGADWSRGEGIKVSNPPEKVKKSSVCCPLPNPSPTGGGAFPAHWQTHSA
ncbi:MAG: hypothetical protein Q4A06_05905 [Cardiobacteriaceae bacterium]|nr:hypothetical protein [Cardiobacteriaceae bacterium]